MCARQRLCLSRVVWAELCTPMHVHVAVGVPGKGSRGNQEEGARRKSGVEGGRTEQNQRRERKAQLCPERTDGPGHEVRNQTDQRETTVPESAQSTVGHALAR